jgi:hypothetical protein
LALRTPANGWPAGIWIVDAEIRRVEGTDWQPLTDERGGRLPLVLVQLPDVISATANYRVRCLWVTFWNPARADRPASPSAEGHETELAALIGEVRAWLGPKVHGYIWNQIKLLEDFINGSFVRRVGYYAIGVTAFFLISRNNSWPIPGWGIPIRFLHGYPIW